MSHGVYEWIDTLGGSCWFEMRWMCSITGSNQMLEAKLQKGISKGPMVVGSWLIAKFVMLIP